MTQALVPISPPSLSHPPAHDPRRRPGRTAASAPLRATIRRAPAREPRFDDEIAVRHLAVVGRDELTLPFAAQAPARRLPPGANAHRSSNGLPEPVRFGRFFVQAMIEVLCGRRPAAQLARHTSARVQAGLTRDQALGGRFESTGRNPVVHSVRIMEPAAQVAELTAVVQVGARFRAIAARLEGRNGQWRCVRLQIG